MICNVWWAGRLISNAQLFTSLFLWSKMIFKSKNDKSQKHMKHLKCSFNSMTISNQHFIHIKWENFLQFICMTISIRNYPTVYCICECEIKPKSLHRNAHKSEITFLFVPLNKRKDKKVNKLYHKFVTDKNKRKIYSSLYDLLFVSRYCKWKIIRQSISQSFFMFLLHCSRMKWHFIYDHTFYHL